MVGRKVSKQIMNFIFKIRLTNIRIFTLLIVFILAFSLSGVYNDVQGRLLNSSLLTANQKYNYYLKSIFISAKATLVVSKICLLY